MATPFLKVYDAFLARITADEWTLEEELAIVERDWQELLQMAIFRFKYPRISLDIEEINSEESEEEDTPHLKGYQFINDLTNDEIQLLALYMKHEWVKRCIAKVAIAREIHKAEGIYDRSREKVPANLFKKLAGKKNV